MQQLTNKLNDRDETILLLEEDIDGLVQEV